MDAWEYTCTYGSSFSGGMAVCSSSGEAPSVEAPARGSRIAVNNHYGIGRHLPGAVRLDCSNPESSPMVVHWEGGQPC